MYQFRCLLIASIIALSSIYSPESHAQSGSLSVPSTCTLPGPTSASTCDVTVNWNSSGMPIACVWIIRQPAPALFACGGNSGSADAPWINSDGVNFELRLYNDWSQVSDYNTGVYAAAASSSAIQPTGSISSNSPCSLSTPGGSCTVAVTWSTPDTAVACVWNLFPLAIWGCSNSPGSATWNWPYATANGGTLELRLHPINAPPSNDSAGYNSGISIAMIGDWGVVPSTPPPGGCTVSVSASSTPIYVGDTATLGASCSTGGAISSISWTIPSGAPTVSGTGGPATFYAAGNFQYSFSACNAGGCGTGTGNVSVIQPVPACTLMVNSQSVSSLSLTAGQSATLSPSCTNSPASFNWSNASGGPVFNGTGGSAMFNSVGTFSYSVQGCNAGGCGTYSPAVAISVSQIPAPASCYVTATPQSISVGGSSTLSAGCNAGGAFSSTSWVLPSGGPAMSGTGGSGTFTSGGNFTYVFNACNAGGCGSGSVTVTVLSTLQYYGYFYSAQDNGGYGYFDNTSQFSDHANLSMVGSNIGNLDHTTGPNSMQAFYNTAVTTVASVIANNAGTTGTRVKAVLTIDPIFLTNPNVRAIDNAHLNPSYTTDWQGLIQALNTTYYNGQNNSQNLLDSIAAFYFYDEPNNSSAIDSTVLCQLTSYMRQNQAGRNIPVMAIYNQTNSWPGINCYDWVGLDDYESPNMFSNGHFTSFKNHVSSSQTIFVVPGVGGNGVLEENARNFYNGALAANAQGGPQISGFMPFIWNASNGGLATLAPGDPYRAIWRTIGTNIITRTANTPLP